MGKIKEMFENMGEYDDMDEILQAHFKKRLLTVLTIGVIGIIIAIVTKSYLFLPYIFVAMILFILMQLYNIICVLTGKDIKIVGVVVKNSISTSEKIVGFLKRKATGGGDSVMIKTEGGVFFEVRGKLPKKLTEGNEITLFTHRNSVFVKNEDTAIVNYPYYVAKSREQG